MNIEPTKNEQEFIAAYLEAVYFTDHEPEVADTPELDETFERESIIDCLAFYQRIRCYISDDEIAQAGQDFWLTRNGHGSGFWDGDWPYYGDMFTKIAESFGEVTAHFEEHIDT